MMCPIFIGDIQTQEKSLGNGPVTAGFPKEGKFWQKVLFKATHT